MPKRSSLSRLSRRCISKGKCQIEASISELSLAAVCSSMEVSDFMDDSAKEDYPNSSSCFVSDSVLHKEGQQIKSSCERNGNGKTENTIPQDVLLEYVKGLQEANKSRDAQTAERLLKELGECLNSLSSASIVVSAGGARAVASSLKLFRFYSPQMPAMDSNGDLKLGISENALNVGTANSLSVGEIEPCSPSESQLKAPRNSSRCVQSTVTSFDMPNAVCIPVSDNFASEVGRKRQRTTKALYEKELLGRDELVSVASDPKLCISTESFLSSNCECASMSETVEEGILDTCVKASTEECSQKEKQLGAFEEQSCIIKQESSKEVAFTEVQQNNVLKFTDQDSSRKYENGLSMDALWVSGIDGSKTITDKSKSSLSLNKFSTSGARESCATTILDTHNNNNESSETDSYSGGEPRKHKQFSKCCEQSEYQDEIDANSLAMSHIEETSVKNMIGDNCKESQKGINLDQKVNPESHVWMFTKEAGLKNVVSAGCFVLERLLTAVLQEKGCSRIQNFRNTGNIARGKPLRAEMYVALTEAFVEIMQPLKDVFTMVMWCLNCLAHILPPCTSESCMGYSSVQNTVASCLASKEVRKKPLTESEVCKVQTASKSMTVSISKNEQMVTPKSGMLSISAAFNSGPVKCQVGGMSSGNQSSNEVGTESTPNSISALAAFAYSATVPMLAEKAVKGILQVVNSHNNEMESTVAAALCALSAHLSSVTSKSLCDDAFAFVIASMKNFLDNAKVQIESFTAFDSLVRTLNSSTGHSAWVAVTVSMDYHRTNLMVQRAGCSMLQTLCSKTAIGHCEWGIGKRPLRTSKDSDREVGVRALVAAMSAFPQDIRIQWYGCSTMWNLVNCAGVESILTMVNCGAVPAVVGAMAVCRTNEVVQQEGCNVLGTMANIMAENECKIHQINGPSSAIHSSGYKSANKHITAFSQSACKEKHNIEVKLNKEPATNNNWLEALWAVVGAMKAFRNSESVQSYGTYALGCMVKLFTEDASLELSFEFLPLPGLFHDNNDTNSLLGPVETTLRKLAVYGQEIVTKKLSGLCGKEEAVAKDVLDSNGKLLAVVEIVLNAMQQFPKIETIQVWGCAVLQQAFPAYVRLIQRLIKYSDDKEPNSPSVVCDLADYSRGFIHSQVHDLCGNHQSSKPFISDLSVPQHASVKGETSVASISECNSKESSGLIVGAVGGRTNYVSHEPYTTSEMNPLKASMDLCDMQMSSTPSEEEVILLKADEKTQYIRSHCYAFLELVLCQAISAMSLLSEVVNLDFTDKQANGVTCHGSSSEHCKPSPMLFGNKLASSKLYCGAGSIKLTVSARQSWFVAFGVLGDVFCDLTKELQNLVGGGSASIAIIKGEFWPQEASNDSSKMLSKHLNISIGNATKDDTYIQEGLRHMLFLKDLLSKKERRGLPLLLKTAIVTVLSTLSMIEDTDTVIWALQALPNLYTAWGTLCVCISGVANHQELKRNLWGDGDVGVKKLVDLISFWTNKNRLDVTILVLHALYCACISTATAHELEDVFGLSHSGIQAILCALQKALSSSAGTQQRKQLIQLSCYVLTAVCSYSVQSQFSFAANGGADLIVAALVRFGEDEQTFKSGVQALGVDSCSESYFSELLDAAVSRNMTGASGKYSKRKKNGSTLGCGAIGFNNIFKESIGMGSSSVSKFSTDSNFYRDGDGYQRFRKEEWNPRLKRLFSEGKYQMGVLQTLLIASPGCGGPLFAVESLKSLNEESQKGILTAQGQAQVCLVISYIAESDTNYRQELINAGAIETILKTMEFDCHWKNEEISGVHMICDGVEVPVELGIEVPKLALKTVSADRGNPNSSGQTMIEKKDLLDASVQCAACWAFANLAKDHGSYPSTEWLLVIQAVGVALRRYGGLAHQTSGSSEVSSCPEVCIPARLVLAQLGVTRIDNQLLSHKASEAGDIVCLETLVSKGVDISVCDDYGRTALWCAEKFGHTHVLHYLKAHTHSQRRKKTRGRPSKCKSSSQQQKQNENVNSSCEEEHVEGTQLEKVDSLQNGHVLDIALHNSSISTQNYGLFDLQRNEMGHGSNGNKNQHVNTVNIEDSLCDEKLVKSEVDPEVQDSAAKNTMNVLKKKKKHRQNTKACVNHREKLNVELKMENYDLNATEDNASEQLTDMTAKESNTLQWEMDSEQLNMMLRVAMASGDVGKLEDALRSCTLHSSKADENLEKKVKAALQKRLRRMERCSILENKLCSAMKEGNKSLLNSTISAIESVPRFATSLQEKLIAARQELNDIENKERMIVPDMQIVSECSNEIEEHTPEAKGGGLVVTNNHVDVVPMQCEEEKVRKILLNMAELENKKENICTKSGTTIKQQCFQDTSNDGTMHNVASMRMKSIDDNNFMIETTSRNPENIQRTIEEHCSALTRKSGNEFQSMSESLNDATVPTYPLWDSLHEATTWSGASWFPQSNWKTCPSVIEPPFPKTPPVEQAAEHYPITAQLFPASGGAPFGYGSNVKDLSDDNVYLDNMRSFRGSITNTATKFIFSSPTSHVHQDPQVNGFNESTNTCFSPRASVFGEPECIPSLFHPCWNSPSKAQTSFLSSAVQVSSGESERCVSFNNCPVSTRSISQHRECLWSCLEDVWQDDCADVALGLQSSRLASPPAEEPLGTPVSDKLVELLQRVTGSDTYSGETCLICQRTFNYAVLVPCGHCICKGCADTVQLRNGHCPICTRFISSVHSLY